jgi:hypothetical protein
MRNNNNNSLIDDDCTEFSKYEHELSNLLNIHHLGHGRKGAKLVFPQV